MQWNVIGQAATIKQLQRAAAAGEPQHAYLFTGPAHLGKFTAAKIFAQALLCERENAPCGICAQCSLFVAGTHPDYMELPEAGSVGIEQVRKLKQELSLKPHSGEWRISVIPNAERLGIPAQNALLKLLEEPPVQVVLILTATASDRLLPTTVSRCRQVRFTTPTVEEVAKALNESQAMEAAELADGRPGLAKLYLEEPERMKAVGSRRELLRQVVEASAADKLLAAKELAEDENLPQVLEDWSELFRRALALEQGVYTDEEPTVRLLAERSTTGSLRQQSAALLAAREALLYNSNVLLVTENALLSLNS